MNNDNFTDAARAEAEKTWPKQRHGVHVNPSLIRDEMVRMAVWARTYLAAQEPTDAECLAVLNVAIVPLGEPPKRNGLADWNPAAVERVRAALSAARAARRDEKGKP